MQKKFNCSKFYGWYVLVVLLMVTLSPAKASHTWTATVKASPNPAVVPLGNSLNFWLEDIDWEVTLPVGEWWSYEGYPETYRWTVNPGGTPNGTGAGATVATGTGTGQVPAGNYVIIFEGSCGYYVHWEDVNHNVMPNPPEPPVLTGWMTLGSKGFTVIKVDLINNDPILICAQTAWSHPNLTTEDHRLIITVTTNPTGYENLINLNILSVLPIGDGTGTLTKVSDTEWHYTALEEARTDKWPGWDNPDDPDYLHWNATIGNSWSGETKNIKIRSLFKYCVLNEHDNQMALAYVYWKYATFIASNALTVGTYEDMTDYGSTNMYTGIVKYGNPSFGSENVLLSIIGHEDVHVDQGVPIRMLGGYESGMYKALVALNELPEPTANPPIGSCGKGWGEMEYPAWQWMWSYRGVTGIINDADFLDVIDAEINFFAFLINNCDYF